MLFWGALALKLWLVADLNIWPLYGPHDESLYVIRAFHLLQGEAFGPWTPQTFSKLPGISFFFAGVRWLGVPLFLAQQLLWAAAALYFAKGLRFLGIGKRPIQGLFLFLLFHPSSFDSGTTVALRDFACLSFTFLLLGGLLRAARDLPHRWPSLWTCFSVASTFSFLQVTREEEKLLLLLLLGFAIAVAGLSRGFLRHRERLVRLSCFCLIPILASITLRQGLRHWVYSHYGTPVLHDLSEGSFPRLLSALRAIPTARHNRYVMVPQETLEKIKPLFPEARPLLELLPSGTGSFSCERLGVCEEWTNGYFPFWFKDAVALSGVATGLAATDSLYLHMAQTLEHHCKEGTFTCKSGGRGFLPPFEWVWLRPLFHELRHSFWRLLYIPYRAAPASSLGPPPGRQTDPGLDRIYSMVTQTPLVPLSSQKEKLAFVPSSSSLTWKGQAALRATLAGFYNLAALLLWPLALLGLFLLRRFPFPRLFLFFAGYACVRATALGYVSVFMGALDDRMYVPLQIPCFLLGAGMVGHSLTTLWRSGFPALLRKAPA